MGHRKVLYKLMFDASAQTLLSFAGDEKYLGATPGIISVLHTWGQQLSFHLVHADRVVVCFLKKNITNTVSARMYTAL